MSVTLSLGGSYAPPVGVADLHLGVIAAILAYLGAHAVSSVSFGSQPCAAVYFCSILLVSFVNG